MDTQELQELIRVVTREVIKRLERRPKVLVILTGAGSVAARVLPQLRALGNLRTLRNRPIEVRIILSPSAETCLGKDFVASGTGLSVTGWQDAGDPLTLVREHDVVVLPALTQNTAASIALGLRNTPTTDLVAWAIIAGKQVIAVPDGIGAGPEELKLLGAKSIPATYRLMLERHLRTIESFGIKLVQEAKLAEAMAGTLGLAGSLELAGTPGPAGSEHPQGSPGNSTTVSSGTRVASPDSSHPVYRARVLAERDLQAILEHGSTTVVISPKTLVTPLARDLAASKNIRIIREGEQP